MGPRGHAIVSLRVTRGPPTTEFVNLASPCLEVQDPWSRLLLSTTFTGKSLDVTVWSVSTFGVRPGDPP